MTVKTIIKQLKRNKITLEEIPTEFKDNLEIIYAERLYGYRTIIGCGYDIISDDFFVIEKIPIINHLGIIDEKNICKRFKLFSEYYNYVNKNIYDKACYTYISDKRLKEMECIVAIDTKRLFALKSFSNLTISDIEYSTEAENEQRNLEYRDIEKIKKRCVQWTKKILACTDIGALNKFENSINESNIDIHTYKTFDFFLWFFVQASETDEKKKKILYKYLEDAPYPSEVHNLAIYLTYCYGLEEVLTHYRPKGSTHTLSKYKRKLKNFYKSMQDGTLEVLHEYGLSKYTHYYFDKITFKISTEIVSTSYRYFETFEEFAIYRNNDLRNCNLSCAYNLVLDKSRYIMDDTTLLPEKVVGNLTKKAQKYYDSRIKKFFVVITWVDENKKIIHKEKKTFEFFFDFVDFLKGDLTGADLLMCDELLNIESHYKINLTGSIISSALCDKFGVEYEKIQINTDFQNSFDASQKYEEETQIALAEKHELAEFHEYNLKINKISYISDLHLIHRLINAGVKSKDDVILVLKKIAYSITSTSESTILIGGDTSSIYPLFEEFVKILHENAPHKTYIFVLGNHELWQFIEPMEMIKHRYQKLLSSYGMYLLQNDLLYLEDEQVNIIPYDELCSIDKKTLRDILKCSRLTILGGIGFAGYEEAFNADTGLYWKTINRQQEMEETEKFKQIYEFVENALSDKQVIVFTHMPKENWSGNSDYHEPFLYVSGHTHRNIFYDDGSTRIYADNQIGYTGNTIYMKSFLTDANYDIFDDYKDGIYEITTEQYHDFYRGKNISLNFSSEVHILYMLKKNGIYAFFHMTKTGSLTILNGGAKKKLDCTDINYYYKHMDIVADFINEPLSKYTQFQKQVSYEIKKIGGSGNIHGCIIDIDFYNHVYINPNDGTIVPYIADSIVYKYVYKNIPSLLKKECPALYDNYLKLIEGSNDTYALKPITELDLNPVMYLNTDIYHASRLIKKMQKIQDNILSIWYDVPESKSIEQKQKLIEGI